MPTIQERRRLSVQHCAERDARTQANLDNFTGLKSGKFLVNGKVPGTGNQMINPDTPQQEDKYISLTQRIVDSGIVEVRRWNKAARRTRKVVIR